MLPYLRLGGRCEDFYDANVVGMHNLIKAMPKQTRLIYVSLPSVYFNIQTCFDIDEQTLLTNNSSNYYIETKKMSEKLVLKSQTEETLKAITICPRGIWGPYDSAIFPGILTVYRNGKMPLVGDNKQLVDITHLSNVSKRLWLAASAEDRYQGQIYTITNGETMFLAPF